MSVWGMHRYRVQKMLRSAPAARKVIWFYNSTTFAITLDYMLDPVSYIYKFGHYQKHNRKLEENKKTSHWQNVYVNQIAWICKAAKWLMNTKLSLSKQSRMSSCGIYIIHDYFDDRPPEGDHAYLLWAFHRVRDIYHVTLTFIYLPMQCIMM